MRRWDGWGFEGVDAHLGDGGRSFLEAAVGPAEPVPARSLADVVGTVPPSRLEASPLVDVDPEARVRHARGQSLPDLLDLRFGRLAAVPDGVATPADRAGVRALLDHARDVDARLIPYGGGTSVVGGVTARPSPDPLITVDCARLAGVSALDERSGLVTAGAGTSGPALAEALAPRGLTVGHEPQSWELATVGGWVAARGSGLRSLGLGRIEQVFAGGILEAPAGTLEMAPYPASAAGPDLRQLVLGSEGRLGFLTDVVLRAVPLPAEDRFDAWALPDWDAGLEATRALARARPGLTSLRLSTPGETRALLAFADRPSQIRALTTYLRVRRRGDGWCLLLAGASGSGRTVRAARAEAASMLRARGGVRLPVFADAWYRARFRSPYLRNAMVAAGYGAETLETAADWAHVPVCSPGSRRRSRARSPHAASGSTCSPTSRTCTRRARACTSPTCSASAGTPTRRSTGRPRSSARRRTRSRARARRSATTTASGRTTRRTSPRRRARSAWPRSRRSCGRSTRRAG